MDEAERCHEIAYIAYGELLTHGTVDEVIRAAHLTTYAVTGDGLAPLTATLEQTQGVDSVAPFGTSLHVSGRNRDVLDQATAAYRDDPKLVWRQIEPSLEDVFIGLMSTARDNMQ